MFDNIKIQSNACGNLWIQGYIYTQIPSPSHVIYMASAGDLATIPKFQQWKPLVFAPALNVSICSRSAQVAQE